MRRPPGPKADSILGNLPLGSDDPLGLFSSWAAQYGDIYHYCALWMHVYFLNSPDYVDYVLVRNPRNFTKDRAVRNLRWLLGDGLLTSEGEHWKRQRRLIQPAFHRERISGYADVMTGCTSDMLAQWRNGDDMDLHREMMQVTLRIVVRCLFGVETDETAAISRSLDLLMKRNTGLRLLMPGWMRQLPLPGTGDARKAVADLNRTVAKIIASRRAGGVDGNDLLGLLMAARDEEGGAMGDRQIRDEVTTFFIAGHETTALTLTWTFYLLSGNPEAAARLREELNRVLAGRVPAVRDIPALGWTECVVKESMRLYPPAWATGRLAVADFELGGYTVPKGSMMIVSPWVMQRQERFFPRAEEFRPERWTNGETQGLPRFAYFPFGGGPRQCIGNNFAMMEAMLVLATIAQRFEVRVDLSKPVVPVTGITLRPRDGMAARIRSFDLTYR